MSIQPGQRLGNYTILRPIGQGGFADVYLGQHIYLNTYAAIKVLQSRMTESDFVSFKTEAQTIANLTHPHIVRVLEFGKESELPFLIMDYCPDGTLRKRHPKGTRISLTECIGYVKQIAAALQYAHSARLIHRDIKPENMLVGKDGTILLSDFGIAVAAQSSRYQSGQHVGGTLVYMAPEQFDGRATFASDQYALAVVVYEWLSGETPFRGSPMEIIAQQFKGQVPSLRAKVANLPPAVELVIQQALKRDPQQRFQSVQQFAEALEQASQGKVPASLNANAPYDTGHISATLRAQPRQSSISTYRNEPAQGTTISPGAPGGTMPASPAGQRPDFSNSSSTGSFKLVSSTQSSYTPPAYTPPAYVSPPSGAMLPPYGQPYPPVQPQKKSKTGCLVAVIVVLVLALIGVSTLALLNGGSNHATSETVTDTTSSNGATVQPTKNAKSRVPAKDGTFTKNIRLSCGGCDDPFVVTITTITVESATGRMAWNVTLYNNSANTYGPTYSDTYTFEDFSLQAATDTEKVQASGSYMNFGGEDTITPGQQVATKFIFSFVPYSNEPYMLNAKLITYPEGDITFTPVLVTFS